MKIVWMFAVLIALANGFPTSPMESVSSGLVAMIQGQGKASRSTGSAPLPIVSNVPLAQSTPLPLMQDQLASTIQPLVVSSPSSMIISSTMPPPLPVAVASAGSSGLSQTSALVPPRPPWMVPEASKYDSKQEATAPAESSSALIPPMWVPGQASAYDSKQVAAAPVESSGQASPPGPWWGPIKYDPSSGAVASPPSVPIASSNVSKQGLFPSQITSLPGALASQMQGQMSSLQQQVTQVGGSLISQTQDQMSSLQSQMASIPSALGSLVPSGLVPQRAPVSTVSPSIVSTIAPVPVLAAVTSVPSVLPIAAQSQ